MLRSTLITLTVCLAACAQGRRPISAIPAMEASAQRIGRGQPTPAWRTDLSAPGTDLVAQVGDRVLVGTMHADVDSWGAAMPRFGPLVLMDVASGRVLWQRERRDLSGGTYVLLSSSPVVLLRGQEREGRVFYQGLDPTIGERIWEQEASPPHATCLATTPDLLLIAEGSAGHAVTVRAIGLADGQVAWRVVLGATARPASGGASGVPGRPGPPVRILQAGTSAVVVGDRVTSLQLSTGQERWITSVPGLSGAGARAVVEGGALFLGTEVATARLSLRDGRLAWQQAHLGHGELLEPAGDALLVVDRSLSEREPAVLRALDLASGRPRWRHAMREVNRGMLLASDQAAYYTTATAIVGVDLGTGERIFERPLDLPSGDGDLPDLLLVRGAQVLAVRESGVSAFSARTGARAWSVRARDGEEYTHAWLQRELAFASTAGARNPGAPGRATGAAAALALDPARPQYLQLAQDHARAVHSGPHTASDGVSASDHAASVTRSWQRSQQAQATVAFMGTAATAGLNVLAELYLSSRLATMQEAAVRTTGLKLEQAVTYHFGSVRGDRFLRPFRRAEGWGLLVVDLGSGRSADLWLIPNPRGVAIGWELMPPLFTTSPDHRRLYALGTGLDATLYSTYQRPCGTFSGLADCTVPFPALLSFDLEDIRAVQEPERGESAAP